MSSDDGTEGETRLRRVLESIGSVYVDDAVGIDFGDEVRINVDDGHYTDGPAQRFVLPARTEEYLGADLTPNEEYELQLDTLNHLAYCRREESWDRTEAFTASTSRPEPLATFVHRMVEHAYVTASRLSEYRGLTGAYARRMDTAFDDEKRVDELRQDEALLEGLREIAYTGQVAELASASENIQGALSFAAAQLDRVRDPSATEELRDEVATRILRMVSSRMYRPRTAERYLRQELDLPFQDSSTLFPEEASEDTDDDDDELTPRDAIEWLAMVPMAPIMFPAFWLGCDAAFEDFFGPLPDGPDSVFFLLYPLLLPVFVVWGLARAVLSRIGYWNPIAEGTTASWKKLRSRVRGIYTRFSGATSTLTEGLATFSGKVAGAVNTRLPGDLTIDAESVMTGYIMLCVFPYLLVMSILGDEPADTFLGYGDVNPPDGILTVLYSVFVPPVFGLLFPVFCVWAVVRAIALELGAWSAMRAQTHRVQAGILTVHERIRHVPVVIVSAIFAVLTLLARWWHLAAYVIRAALGRLYGDDWRRDIPDTVDRDELHTRDDSASTGKSPQEDGVPTARQRDATSSVDDATTPAQAEGAQTDEETRQPQVAESERAAEQTTHSANDHNGTGAAKDINDQLLADAKARSGSSRGEVTLVSVEYETTDGNVLDNALGELSTLDRRTASELQALRADRDGRIGRDGSVDDILSAVRDRELDELIQKLFAQFPPEERRETRGQTGHRLDLPSVARSAGGRLPNEGPFVRHRHTETGSRCVGVAIDLSSSMDAFEAKVALAALARAADLLDDDFLAVGFRGRNCLTPLVTGPTEPFEPAHLTSIETGGSTPLAAGVRECRRLLKTVTADDQVLLVITDGSPNVGFSDGDGADADARSEIDQCRQDGIGVIGVGVDAYGMASLFGDEASVKVNDEQFAARLLEIYREQYYRTRRR